MSKTMIFIVALVVMTAGEALFFRLQGQALDSKGMVVCAAGNALVILFANMLWNAVKKRAPKKSAAESKRHNATNKCVLLLASMLTLHLSTHAQSSDKTNVCVGDQIAALRGESVHLRYVGPVSPKDVKWKVTDGVLSSAGADVWTLKNIPDATTWISAKAIDPAGAELCHFDLAVLSEQKLANQKYTGTGFITQADLKEGNMGRFGMYSYLLFVHPVTSADEARCRTILMSYFENLTPTLDLQRFFPAERINVFLLPVKAHPEGKSSSDVSTLVDWTTNHLDVPFSKGLTDNLKGTFTQGPYIVSCSTSLSTPATGHDQDCLVQDLSAVPDKMLGSWIKYVEFQAAHQDGLFSLEKFTLEFRTLIEQIALDEGDVVVAVDKVLAFGKRAK